MNRYRPGVWVAICSVVVISACLMTLVSRPELPLLAVARSNVERPLAWLQRRTHHGAVTTAVHTTLPMSCRGVVTQPNGNSIAESVRVASMTRTYWLYLPKGYHNSVLHALVLDFHGYATNAQYQERLSGFDPVANAQQFIVVYPEGTLGVSGARGWDTGLHPSITSDDLTFTKDLIAQLEARLCINPRQIYATGFSNGAGFVNLLACDPADSIAAFAPVSGSYVTPSDACQPARPVPIIEFHGAADTAVPYNGNVQKHEPDITSWLTGWATRDQCDPTPQVTAPAGHLSIYVWQGCNGGTSIVHYDLQSGHHAWPSGTFPSWDGSQPPASAAALIWHFFAEHPLPLKSVRA